MKIRHIAFLIIIILIADQALKFWVKTHMFYHEEREVLGSWFRLYFIENEGMAYGWKFGGEWGKLALTLFRFIAVVFGTWYIGHIIRRGYHKGFIICAGLIYAGALGNLIDSLFYGLIFSFSDAGAPVATLFPKGGGYGSFLHGRVVDMLYFPLIENRMMPEWVPIWGGRPFTFFQPIFNIADASISIGVITILLFQKRFFRQRKPSEIHPTIETSSNVSDETQVY